ncbi:hypothetical protein CHUAL_011906 [Chamberlinius hualienensis]
MARLQMYFKMLLFKIIVISTLFVLISAAVLPVSTNADTTVNFIPKRCDFCSCYVRNVNVAHKLCRTLAFVVEFVSATVGF